MTRVQAIRSLEEVLEYLSRTEPELGRPIGAIVARLRKGTGKQAACGFCGVKNAITEAGTMDDHTREAIPGAPSRIPCNGSQGPTLEERDRERQSRRALAFAR